MARALDMAERLSRFRGLGGPSSGSPPPTISISGDVYHGQTLTAVASDGTLQWYAGASAISGETSSTYVVDRADGTIGPAITCRATNAGGTTTSNALAYSTATRIGSKLTVLQDDREQDGSPIDTWQNQDASVADFTAATTARPATGRTIGGQPAPDFNGTTNVLSSTSTMTDMTSPATPAFHVQVVVNVDAINTTSLLTAAAANDQVICNVPGYFGIGLRNNTGAYEVQCWLFSTIYEGVTLTGYTLGTSALVDFWATGGAINARLADGATQTDATVAAIPAGAPRNGPIKIGANSGSSHFYDGAIARVMVANVALSAGEQADERAYCAWKYGVTV